jgi:hypothetical protein
MACAASKFLNKSEPCVRISAVSVRVDGALSAATNGQRNYSQTPDDRKNDATVQF